MTMRRSLCVVFALTMAQGVAFAQAPPDSPDASGSPEQPAATSAAHTNFHVYMNLQNSLDLAFADADSGPEVNFRAAHLRLELLGTVHRRVHYRFRHRLNREAFAQNLDNLSRATDVAQITIDVSDLLSIDMGKMITNYGGYEYDLNPIDVYQFSDLVGSFDAFANGINVRLRPHRDHQLNLHVINSRGATLDAVYGDALDPSIEPSDLALGYVLNWNGRLLQDLVQTRWSAAILQEAEEHYSYFAMLGTQLVYNNLRAQFDVAYLHEDIDRLGFISSIKQAVELDAYTRAMDVTYIMLMGRIDYRVHERVNTFVKGLYEPSSIEESFADGLDPDAVRTSSALIGGIEYTPTSDPGLKLFAVYVGRRYSYDDAIAAAADADDNSTIKLGIVYRLQML